MISQHLRILKATFFETGTTQDMVSHAMGTHIDPNVFRLFGEKTRDGTMISQESLAGIAGQIIRPDVNNERTIHLPNGGQNVRYRFLMTVGNPEALNSSIYYYSGYTDVVGYSQGNGVFDPHMRLYFNNVIEVNQVMKPGPNGPVPTVNVVECSHLIHPLTLGANAQAFQTTFDPNGGFGIQNQPASLRPTDVMMQLSSQTRSNIMGAQFGENYVDARIAIDLCKSDRSNAIPSYYLDKTVDGMLYGINASANDPSSGGYTPYDKAFGYIEEKNVFNDRFFSLLAHDFGYHQNGFISWGDMARAHSELMQRDVVFLVRRPQMQKNDIFLADHREYDQLIGDRRPQTLLVEQIMQSLPGALIGSLISFARIHVTNMGPGGRLMVTITDPISYANLGAQYLVNKIPFLEQQLQRLVFADIGFNQYIPFDAWFTVDVFGESFVRIAFNGEHFYTPYAFATYGDASASMLVTSNGNTLPAIANDLNYLIQHTLAF